MNNNEKAQLAFYLFIVKDRDIEMSVTESQRLVASEYFESITTLELIEQVSAAVGI
ncbi:hypothetical protein JCM19241_895 [Vibrio ishigakensis]|uniref:Uncharacterized protein n=1 Tax=Vibrio ishigakensis TaxID=1481914 RepID=A0A0B8QC95_9VIBR|nr:hypothetical protein JCM19241_895 [Vibrio ishigakensis]